MSDVPIIGITMGDPAGVGPEIAVKGYQALAETVRPVVIGDADVIRQACEVCGSSLEVQAVTTVRDASFETDRIPVLNLANVTDLKRGVVREAYGEASLAYVRRAIELAQRKEVAGIVTAPINKQATKLAGSDHAGHTGLLAEATGTEDFAMMLIEDDLRVTHVSTHVPLREACDIVTEESVQRTIRVTDEALYELGVDSPQIAVAGLNPHASDGGLLGQTEADAIAPAIEKARGEGIEVFGPQSPDTVYVQAARGNADCVVSMYHDQGHIPIKMLGFADGGTVSGVNVTIGLPIIRTSVDHGTAFDIAGKGIASEQSLLDAVAVAREMATHRLGTSTKARSEA
jgi:4-phospho-D-threonate 3-dehydrogenase / 4-phospho-D-erythronate 3-dehydrogenase